MAKKALAIKAYPRTTQGTQHARRLRREKMVPAIIYGGAGKECRKLSLLQKDINKAIYDENYYSHLIEIQVEDGEHEQVILKELTLHVAANQVQHVDFLRVDSTHKIHLKVPIHFTNEDNCIGVKTQSGIISHTNHFVEVTCRADSIPEYIEVDMAEIEAGQNRHLSDLVFPEGVTSTVLERGGADLMITNVLTPRGGMMELDEEEEAVEGEEAAETDEETTEEATEDS